MNTSIPAMMMNAPMVTTMFQPSQCSPNQPDQPWFAP